MNAQIESRTFKVVGVSDPSAEGHRRVTLTCGDEAWTATAKGTLYPAVGEELKIFYQEGALDFAFEGLTDAVRT